MKPALILVTCVFVLVMLLTGCVAVPYPEPVVYGPPPPATVVVRPAPRYHHHYRHEPYWRRGWR